MNSEHTLEYMVGRVRALLAQLGMDAERTNDRSVFTFLALANLSPNSDWQDATNEMHTVSQIMDWILEELHVPYAANTREHFRRDTLYQFIAGGIVQCNADYFDKAVNSPKTNYRLVPELLAVIHALDTPAYEQRLSEFLSGIETWNDQVAARREMSRIPVRTPDGKDLTLSAGGQNHLIKQMVEEFCPRFVGGGEVLYIDDADRALGEVADDMLSNLGIDIPEHGKAPDLIVWDDKRNWVFMMEACSTHGPIDVLRKRDFRSLFADAQVPMVFVSGFPNRMVMGRHLPNLAWGTEAWCADSPDHLIHLNGMSVLAPDGS